MKNLPGPFCSPLMFQYNEKISFTYNIQSIDHCSNFRKVADGKCVIFKDIFPGLSKAKIIFQDFPGPGIFKKKIQDCPGDVGTLRTDVSTLLIKRIKTASEKCV